MAPYPENDKAPKAPDKNTEKSKVSCGRTTESRQQPTSKSATENDTKVSTVCNLLAVFLLLFVLKVNLRTYLPALLASGRCLINRLSENRLYLVLIFEKIDFHGVLPV